MPIPETQVTLRAATMGDKDFLWRLHRETMRQYVDQTWGWDDDWQRQRFDENFNPDLLQIIECGQKPAGYIAVEWRDDGLLLGAIEIAPEFQNRGIGTQLILELFRECDRRRRPMRLSVLKVNPARRLYERLGFLCVEETATHYIMRRLPGAAM
jgi:ribosomal protein S18 acetylase RimI-like enzyme